MKKELLVPVGNMDSLYQAVVNGADAVYLAGKNYGARKFADNFSNEEIIDAISYCHLYDVRVYITMNTLVKDCEVPSFLAQVEFLHKNGVDAIIMQDFGMISLVREMFPNLEIHASTQANNSSIDTIKLFYEMGIKRVVFSREMSLEEIDSISIPIEKEVFVHGALCISYSGCCLMSSMIGGRSGNRGECAGSCRLPYRLYFKNDLLKERQYLLSTKELNTSSRFKELLKSSIYSFKIEGRMKSPEYVGFITKFYRNLIDNQGSLENFDDYNNQLKTIYNREFTTGHLFGRDNLMNTKTPNHIGLTIGRVIDVNSKRIKIKLNRNLHQGDGIRFLESGKGFTVNYLYDQNGKLVSSSHDVCYVLNTIVLKQKETVSKTYDIKLNHDLHTLLKKSIFIEIKVCAKIGERLSVFVEDGKNIVKVFGHIVAAAKNSPISVDRIKKQVEKLGNTPFVSSKTTIESDYNVFVSIKEINTLRREAIDQLIKIRSFRNSHFVKRHVSFTINQSSFVPSLTALVYNEEQLLCCLDKSLKRIYVVDLTLYNKYRHYHNVYYKVPRCSRSVLDHLKNHNLVGDYFDFSKEQVIGDYGLNVTNIYTAYYLYRKGLHRITLSVELSDNEVCSFIESFYNKFHFYLPVEVILYGRVENMVIKGNILNLDHNNYHYKLVDLRKRVFPVYFDGENTYVLNYEKIKTNSFAFMKKHCDIRFIFFDEGKKDIEDIVKYYR